MQVRNYIPTHLDAMPHTSARMFPFSQQPHGTKTTEDPRHNKPHAQTSFAGEPLCPADQACTISTITYRSCTSIARGSQNEFSRGGRIVILEGRGLPASTITHRSGAPISDLGTLHRHLETNASCRRLTLTRFVTLPVNQHLQLSTV